MEIIGNFSNIIKIIKNLGQRVEKKEAEGIAQ
jgi:hypothetical protein